MQHYSWAAAGTYDVVAEARCATHTGLSEISTASTVSVAGGDSLRLADTFSDGTAAGDPQWRVLSGRWMVGADRVFTGARTDAVNLAVVRALRRFKTGRVTTRVALTPRGLEQHAGVVFALGDAHHYRYVTIGGSGIAIGQVGDTPKVKAGRKAFVRRALAAGQWQRLRVDVLPNGTVKVFLGTSRKPVLAYRFADTVAGGVGVLAARSVAYFDDYRVWGRAGFDESFEGWGFEDSDLAVRLLNAGVRRKEGAFATGVLHLWHRENDRRHEGRNWELLQDRIRTGATRPLQGLPATSH